MSVLLIVDAQKGFITKNNEFIIKNIENLLKNNHFDYIFATKFVNKEDSPFVKISKWNKMFAKQEQELAIALPKQAKIVEKSTFGLSQSLINEIKKVSAGGGEVLLCGTDYDSCVLAIAYQLFDNGIKPVILEHCIGTHSNHAIKLKKLKRLYNKNFGDVFIARY